MADGSTVVLDVPGFQVNDIWNQRVIVRRGKVDGRRPDAAFNHEFNISPRGNARGLMEHLLAADVAQQISMQGGTLLVAHSRERETQGIAVWEGRWHEMSTLLLPGEKDSDALSLFDGLLFDDTPDGLQVRPTADRELGVMVAEFATGVEGVGEVEITPATASLAAVPQWSGARVRAGEVWRVDLTLDEDPRPQYGLRLASRSAVVNVIPTDTGDAQQREPLRFLDELRSLSWEQKGATS
ncbi:hypothetical protein [Serinicoccus kebangsaanensis]|uniref:hypothetical protein n=1 Tax=Serinicoccus kebangsaanensis TaxID=2602069 RepID=UPI00124DC38B|nr:hypothetical protein [Serinicoccus kebangsaanensis]